MASIDQPATNVYDLCIIGAGMIGSSAAKYAAHSAHKVCLIGQNEPDRSTFSDTSIFGAHYDEGRIACQLYPSPPCWSWFDAESIKRYREIETKSGINFYTENGYLALFNNNYSKTQLDTENVALKNNIDFERLPTSEHVHERFPFVHVPAGTVGLFQSKNSGTINPRRFIAAQKTLAKEASCTIFDDVAIDVKRDDSGLFEVLTQNGVRVLAQNILLCAGAFLFHNRIYPPSVPKLRVIIAYAIAVRLPVPNPRLLDGMPSIGRNDFYMLAPIKYPDGKFYVKLGMETSERRSKFESEEVISEWFRTRIEPERVRRQVDIMCDILPGDVLDKNGMQIDTCVFVATEDENPMIDEIAPNYFVVTGDNGMGAKAADEIGRLASVLAVEKRWDCEKFSRDLVKARFE